ncbi:MAG: hypothetical protein IKB67_03330 [Clostridia bacterium]|nr:hypothetical protein [Clostridia bacterium]
MLALIFCVECNKKSESDKMYISNVIKNFYKLDTSIKTRYLNFAGKGKYKSEKIKKEIEKIKAEPHYKQIKVVYCVDADKIQADPDTNKLNEEIKKYCKKNNYEFVWFCRNIEDVFLHKTINNSKEKIKAAKKVGRVGGIGLATEKTLTATKLSENKSNLMSVVDKVLQRK